MAVLNPTSNTLTPPPTVNQAQSGMLQTPAGYTAPQAQTAQTSQIAPVQADIATQNQQMGTVQGRVASILDANSPLMQRARARANQASNARGLGNSSMAVGAAQNAVINTAMPIANADANSYNQFAMNNQRANNSMLQFNAGNQQQVNLNNTAAQNNMNSRNATADQQAKQFGAQQSNAMSSTQAQLDSRTNMFNAQQQNKVIFDQLDQNNKIEINRITAAYKNEMQANVSSQNLTQNLMSAMKGIQDNTTMSPATKQKNLDSFVRIYQIGMKLAGGISNLNLTSYLNFKVHA